MKRIQFVIAFIAVILCFCLQLETASAQPVAGRILDGVSIKEDSGKIAVSINFNFPVRYLSHFPDEAGRELRIQLQPISVSSDDLDALSKRESFTPTKDNPANITEIIYEGDSYSNLFMTVYFNSQTNFSVKQGSDYRSLLVLVDPQIIRGSYAINLESSLAPIDISAIQKQGILRTYSLYTTQSKVNGQIWYRLRLGFFPSQQAANEALKEIKAKYPQAWVTKVPQSDRIAAKKATTQPTEKPSIMSGTPQAQKQDPQPKTQVRPLTAEKKNDLLNAGKEAMLAEDYRRAVQIYTRLIATGEAEISRQALEYLGLARERNNQLAHAKTEYEKYLTLYPSGEGAERVKQRLAGVLTARATPKEKLRQAKNQGGESPTWQTDVYGSFSQFYDRDESYTNNEDAIVDRSSLSTDLDLNARFRSEDYDIRTSFSGGYENNFLDDDDSDKRVSSMYVDVLAHKLKLSTRVGRQSRSSGGVLGRFDGALIKWQAFEKVGINLVGGYPVASSSDTGIDNTRPLYGISFDLGTYADRWDFNTFYISQNVDGIIDREAIGGEVRFFQPNFSFFSLVDYDISYDQMNTFLFNGNWSMTKKTTINFSTDIRQSPILTTSNALQSQTASSIDELLLSFTETEIRQLAIDRTASSRSYTIGITHSFNTKLQVSADTTMAKISGTPSSGGVIGYEGTGYDYFYSLQFIGNSLIKEGDIAIIGLRYSDTNTSRTYSANINTRYPITRNLRINPRFLIDYRTTKENDNELFKFRPLVRLEYRWRRYYNFEIEGGLEFTTDKTSSTTDDRRGYFLTVGYRIDF
jgi:SPOR domain